MGLAAARLYSSLLLIAFLFLFEAVGTAQELGVPPLIPRAAKKESIIRSAAPAYAAGDWYDTTSRGVVQSAWTQVYLPGKNIPLGFSGAPGTTSDVYKNAVLTRVNWFRAMAGVPSGLTLNAEYSRKSQLGAYMLRSNNALSHEPPQTWINYTAEGAEALGHSNLCKGFISEPGCVTQYVEDQASNNYLVGHRRWLFYPQTRQVGTGDVPDGNVLWNSLWVIDDANLFTPRPATRDEFVAWPPKGYVPYQVVFPRWSLSFPGADFSSATVSVRRNNTEVPVQVEYRSAPSGAIVGEETIVWIPEGQNTNPIPSTPVRPSADTVYSVTVANVVVNGSPRTFTYNVIVFDPSTGTPGGCTFSLSSSTSSVPSTGLSGTVMVNATEGSCSWTASSNRSWAQVYPLSGTGTQSLQYTVFPNYGTNPRSAVLTVGGQAFTLNQAGTTGTPDARFVGQIYFSSFGRTPAPDEIQLQAAQVAAAGRSPLVMNFLRSEEFNQGARFIAGLYVGLLNRDPEYGGWLFQRNALSTGLVSPFQLVENFLNSEEYKQKFGTPTNAEFVRLLYRYILLREATTGEVNFQAGALQSGTTRVQLAWGFLRSAEFEAGTGPRLTAFLIYAALLNRDPSGTEMEARAAEIRSGLPLASIVTSVLNSSEFQSLLM